MKTTSILASFLIFASMGASAASMDRATPESQGMPSSAIVAWIDACEREIGTDVKVSKNPLDFKNATIEKTPQGWVLVRPDGFRLAVGDGTWGTTAYTFPQKIEILFALVGTRDIAASGAWTAPGVLTVRWHLLGAPQHGKFTVTVPGK